MTSSWLTNLRHGHARIFVKIVVSFLELDPSPGKLIFIDSGMWSFSWIFHLNAKKLGAKRHGKWDLNTRFQCKSMKNYRAQTPQNHAMLATKRSAGVAPEVNLESKSKTGVSVVPQKGLMSYRKKKHLIISFNVDLRHLTLIIGIVRARRFHTMWLNMFLLFVLFASFGDREIIMKESAQIHQIHNNFVFCE